MQIALRPNTYTRGIKKPAMTRSAYEAYLQSPEWKQKAYQRMQIDNFQCCMCGSRGTRMLPLEAHHLGYRCVGTEDVYKDLLTLCRPCHKAVHKMMTRTTGFNPDGSPRHGWATDVPNYTVHVYSLSGDDNVEMMR